MNESEQYLRKVALAIGDNYPALRKDGALAAA